jgi:hypothetical protein
MAPMADALELELVPEEKEPEKRYEFLDDDDQQLRAFIFETIGNADIDGAILIHNMQAVFDWIKNGPAQPQQHKRSTVRKVSDNG